MLKVVHCPCHALTQRSLQVFPTHLFLFLNCQFPNCSSQPCELGGALIQPAGWQGGAIESLWEPSIHQSGEMLNPSERTLPLLLIYYRILSLSLCCHCVFIFHTQTRCSPEMLSVWSCCCCWGGVLKEFSCSVNLFYSTKSWLILYFHLFFCGGGQSFPYSFRDSAWMMESTITLMGAPFPSMLESLWMEND